MDEPGGGDLAEPRMTAPTLAGRSSFPAASPPAGLSILITGAGGGLGRLLTRSLRGAYPLSLLDRKPDPGASGLPYFQMDLACPAGLSECLAGVDTILHFAGIPTARASWDSLLASNVLATQNLLRAALQAGCRRLILASSVQVVDGYPAGFDITPDRPVWPVNRYGVSKACAEEVAARFGRKPGLSVICLRLGWVLPAHDRRITPGSPYLDRILTESDFLRAIRAVLAAETRPPYTVHHVLSDNRRKRLNIDSMRSAFGYRPRDDSFRLARTNWPGMAWAAAAALRSRAAGLRRRFFSEERDADAAG